MTKSERDAAISRYAAGVNEVLEALEGFHRDQLRAHPIPGKWSAAEIVHHLADSETHSAIRLRKLLCEEHAEIQGYDQEHYATRMRYNERDIDPSLEAFKAARATTLQVIRLMTDADWAREGRHSESGRYTAEDWLRIYAQHAHGHAGQIRRLREALVAGRA